MEGIDVGDRGRREGLHGWVATELDQCRRRRSKEVRLPGAIWTSTIRAVDGVVTTAEASRRRCLNCSSDFLVVVVVVGEALLW